MTESSIMSILSLIAPRDLKVWTRLMMFNGVNVRHEEAQRGPYCSMIEAER